LNKFKTTHPFKGANYPNLIKGLLLNDVNQLWSSDITYFYSNGNFYYINFILDVYSRMIIGYTFSDNLFCENNVSSLKMALNYRQISSSSINLIHHSDRGSQYLSNAYTNLLISNKIRISLSKECYENAYSERLNGIIKNEYLRFYSIGNLKELVIKGNRAVKLYNEKRPHLSLFNMNSPAEFEEYIKTVAPKNRPKFRIAK
jgi:transposase InsO family protein